MLTRDYAKNQDLHWNLAIKTDPGIRKEDITQESEITFKNKKEYDAFLEQAGHSKQIELKKHEKSQSNNFKNDFPECSIEYIFGPGPWR